MESKPRYVKAILIDVLLELICFVWIGLVCSFLGLTVRKYDSISPPQALIELNFITYFQRLFNGALFDGWIWHFSIGALLVIPILSLIGFVLYCLFTRKRSTLKIVAKWILVGTLSLIFSWVIFFIFVPAPITIGMYHIVIYKDIKHAHDLVRTELVETNPDVAIRNAIAAKDISIYSDYGSGAALLDALIHETKGEKLTFYESFYMPIYFFENKQTTGIRAIDTSPIFLVHNNALVFGDGVTKDMIEQYLPELGKHALISAYGSYITNSKNVLTTFKVIPASEYQSYYQKKVTSDLQSQITSNQKALKINMDIIDTYASNLEVWRLDYKKNVTDLQMEYQDGCVTNMKYNNCPQIAAVIEQNIAIENNNKASLDYNYQQASQFNPSIESSIASGTAKLASFTNNKNSLENDKSEYSAGVMFDGDTVYMLYSPEQPINGDMVRIITHELLHLYAYNSKVGGIALPEAFNEGATDYLATRALGYSELDSIRAAGYPLEVQVITGLLEKIPYDSFLKVYFTQDREGLKKLFVQYFPQVNYDAFMVQFENIFAGTYHFNGASHDFSAALIDHPDVVAIRHLLGLDGKKFPGVQF